MPRFKRWFHVNQDINFDPEFDRLCRECGAGGIRFFLQAMSILEKTENHWDIHKDFSLNVLARSCGTKPKLILSSYRLLIDMNWISVGVDNDMNQFIFARNYVKYRGNRGHESEMTKHLSSSPPILDLPLLQKKEKNHKNDSQRKCGWPKDFVLTEKMVAYAREQNINSPISEFEHFRNNALAKGYKYLDWERAWQNWCRSPYQHQRTTNQEDRYA